MSYRVCEKLVRLMRMILFASCSQTGKTYAIAACTVKYSWWWTEKLSETCRVSFQNKTERLVHLVGFITRNLLRCTIYERQILLHFFHVLLFYNATMTYILTSYTRISLWFNVCNIRNHWAQITTFN